MGIHHRRKWTIIAFALWGLVLGSIFSYDRSGFASQRGKPMNVTQITIDHVRVSVDKPFDKVTKAFEQQLGHFDHETYKSLAAGEDTEKVRKKIEAMVGPSGFMLFRTSDHGALCAWPTKRKKRSSIWSAIRCSRFR